jgi:hypothetical protein
MTGRTPIRHGEVLLLPVDHVPDGTKDEVTQCIVGHSESGHHHVLESGFVFAQIIAANGDMYVDLDTPTPLRHHKSHHQHRELTVPAGAWRVLKKTEFDVRTLPPALPEPPIRPQRIRESDYGSVPERRWRRAVRD